MDNSGEDGKMLKGVESMEENETVFVCSNLDLKSNQIAWKDSIRQIMACCIAHSIVIQVGVNMSYSAILLPQLYENGSEIKITKSQASWIASIVAIALPFGAFIIGPFIDKFGRQKVGWIISIPFLISWICQIFANEVWHIYVARILAGFSGGLTTVILVYVSEIAHPEMRQMLLSLNSVFVSMGVLLTYLFGTLFKWRWTAVIFSAMTFFTGVGIYFLPESPHWLITFKGDYKKAQSSLRWLYKNDHVYEIEYRKLLEMKRMKTNQNQNGKSTLTNFRSEMRVFKDPTVYKPFIILMLLFLIQQLTGVYVIIFYATDIFRKVGEHFEEGIHEFTALVLLGAIRFGMSILSALISKKVGRRKLLFISGFGMSICSFLAGMYMHFTFVPTEKFEELNIQTSNKNYNIALICVLGYVSFGALGYLIIPWTLIGELLPVKVKGKLGSVLVANTYLIMFLLVKAFQIILESIDIHCLFYILSVFNLIGVVFVFIFLPETLGKTFDQIEQYFNKQ